MNGFAPPSKPVTLVPFKGRCQIRSKLLHFIPLNLSIQRLGGDPLPQQFVVQVLPHPGQRSAAPRAIKQDRQLRKGGNDYQTANGLNYLSTDHRFLHSRRFL